LQVNGQKGANCTSVHAIFLPRRSRGIATMKQIMLSASIAGVILAGCASQPAGKAVTQTRAGLADAALSPLEDLNLRRDTIPAELEAIEHPYQVPASITCEGIESELADLDRVLPPDWDEAAYSHETSLSERAASTASDGVLDTVASEARELIPYRSWVRRLSGANSHDKKLKAAFDRGNARRTYLKAIGRTKSCKGIAPPEFEAAVERGQVVYRGDRPSSQTETAGPENRTSTVNRRVYGPAATGSVDLRPPEGAEAEQARTDRETGRKARIKREAQTSWSPSEN
jgi:hypothetical protein